MRNPVKLLCVTGANNNKYYNMVDNGDGTFTATYGRVGVTNTAHTYPIGKWDAKYYEKVRKKGYTDMSNLMVEESDVSPARSFEGINDPEVRNLISRLQKFARGAIYRTYTVSSKSVTPAMVSEAQDILNELSRLTQEGRISVHSANDLLLKLYHVIPRRMGNVGDHLVHINHDIDKHGKIQTIISEEQDNVDMMGQQVGADSVEQDDSASVLDAMGISIHAADQEDVAAVNAMNELGSSAVGKIYRVVNDATHHRFAEFISTKPPNGISLLWHGSRDQNWLSILERGLLIRPTGVITTGSMFGNGIYFADCLTKSKNYAGEFCALFNVYLGNKLKMPDADYSLSAKELARRGAYDSVWGARGHTRSWGLSGKLVRDEFIIYNQAQATIAYLVQVTS